MSAARHTYHALPAYSSSANFDEDTLSGRNDAFAKAVDDIGRTFHFDFVSIGLTSFPGAPLRWVYSYAATNQRYRRIALAPGHGIGGIVIKSGKPMLMTDIDGQMDPRAYSGYPIVFAEDLRSFCALPLVKSERVVGALLMAHRTSRPGHEAAYRACIRQLGDELCGLEIRKDGFLATDELAQDTGVGDDDAFVTDTTLARIIGAQEEERRRISREVHDGVTQEILCVALELNKLSLIAKSDEEKYLIQEAHTRLQTVMDQLHDLSVELRPSALDHFGLTAALRSQAEVLEGTYGVHVEVSGTLGNRRFDPTYETQVYRIIQEALTNACKYAGCDQASVCVDYSDGWVNAVVHDDGVGFDTANPKIKGSGRGLTAMAERARLIGARLDVASGSAGTTVTLVSPLGRRQADTGGQQSPESSTDEQEPREGQEPRQC